MLLLPAMRKTIPVIAIEPVTYPPINLTWRSSLAWVIKPMMNMTNPKVVDEEDLLRKAESQKAKPI